MHPEVLKLHNPIVDVLKTCVRPKFNAYFEFTKNSSRAQRISSNTFIYPSDSVISDLTVLASLFAEIDQAFQDHSKGRRSDFAAFLALDANLLEDFRQIVDGNDPNQGTLGSFWMRGPSGGLESVSTNDTIQRHLETLLKTLRNGFAHFHWRYDDLSALAYWNAQNWSKQGSPLAFDLHNRPANNYMIYIADAANWNPADFWNMQNLRILATPIATLRYSLHLNLQQILNNDRVDIFGNRK
jgi:hypothetical protein